MNIYQKIQAVMQDIQYLAKDDQVSFGTTKYKAISEEKVTTTVRASMIKNGLVMFPETLDISKDGQITTVNVTYKMVNVDDPTEQIIIASCGQGSDTQDKGSGKAMTYAYKYALLRTFAIPTGEDPDKISSAELDAKQELTDPVVNAGLVKAQIMGMAKNDLERVNTFINKLFATDGTATLDDLSDSQLVQLKTAIAKKVQK